MGCSLGLVDIKTKDESYYRVIQPKWNIWDPPYFSYTLSILKPFGMVVAMWVRFDMIYHKTQEVENQLTKTCHEIIEIFFNFWVFLENPTTKSRCRTWMYSFWYFWHWLWLFLTLLLIQLPVEPSLTLSCGGTVIKKLDFLKNVKIVQIQSKIYGIY